MPLLCIALLNHDCSGQAVKIVCPVIQQYTAAEQQAALNQYQILKTSKLDTIVKFMDDYGKLRRQIRACQNEGA